MRGPRVAWLVLPVLCFGCRGSDRGLMPLEVGNEWAYSVRSGFITAVQNTKVTRKLAVAGHDGYQLESPMGNSRLAWVGSRLVAEELGGVRYSPAVTLYDSGAEKHEVAWSGFAIIEGRSEEASSTLSVKPVTYRVAGRDYRAWLATIEMKVQGKNLELQTWYVDGIGVIKQIQRANGNLERALDYLSGP